MTLSEFQREWCLKIVEKLMSLDICKYFIEMVDPEKDQAPGYYDIITEAMALGEVKRRLESCEYQDLASFKRDVNLIWQNAVEYNGEESFFADMAKEASLWFNNKMKHLPASSTEEWLLKVQRTIRNFHETLSHPPGDLDPGQKSSHRENDEN